MTVAVLGEGIVDLIQDNEGAYRPHLGGSPYNVATALARYEETVFFLSPFSRDRFGDFLHSSLVDEGVRIPLRRRSDNPTSIALIFCDDNGEPSYSLYRNKVADKDISVGEIIAQIPANLTLFHTGSLAITPSQLPKIVALFKFLKQRSIVISLDLNIRLGATSDAGKYLGGVKSLLSYADIVKASDEDLEPFNFSANPEQAALEAYQQQGEGIFLLTQGAQDTVLISGSQIIRQKPIQVSNVHDTIGAGDTFFAAFLARLRQGEWCHLSAIQNAANTIGEEALSEALAYANTAAAINISRPGCSPPTKKEIEQYHVPNYSKGESP